MTPLNDIKLSAPSSGMNKDLDPSLIKSDTGVYTHMINGKINSHQGNLAFVQDEPSTTQCGQVPYSVIGDVRLRDGRQLLFSTDDINSEIGVYDPKSCTYTKIVNNQCLNFRTSNLIRAVVKEGFDCSESVYFTDGLNPRRVLNLNDIPYKFITEQSLISSCEVKEFTDELDCSQLLLDRKFTYPTANLSAGPSGNIRNGAYQVAIAYTVNQQQVTDYMSITIPQPIFSHENTGRSLQVTVNNLDPSFDEYRLLLIYTINQTTTAEIVGHYPTEQSRVTISSIGGVPVPLSNIVVSRPFYDTAEDVVSSGDHLLWSSPSTRSELNYQLQAMSIVPKWVSYRVPEDYYRKGGTLVGYLRDEVYAFYIQWLYSSGHWSPAFHIPGRRSESRDMSNSGGQDVYELRVTNEETRMYKKWETENTASNSDIIYKPEGSEYTLGEGEMGYYESTDIYPDNESLYGEDACSPIRHPRFPDACVTHTHTNGEQGINLLGVKFTNIEHPKDENGNPIQDIVGFRILRASRENDKSILAKGLIFNTGQYDLPDGSEDVMYSNYPYNDLRVDPFLSTTPVRGGISQLGATPMGTFLRDTFTFHSPSTSFSRPSLGTEFKVETEEVATVEGRFEDVYKHPRHKLIKDFALLLSAGIGTGEGILATKGKKTTSIQDPTYFNPPTMLGTSNTAPGGGAAALADYQKYITQLLGEKAWEQMSGSLSGIINSILSTDDIPSPSKIPTSTLSGVGGFVLHGRTVTTEETALDNLPGVFSVGQKAVAFGYYFAQGTSTALNVLRAFLPFTQYAKQYVSHGFYNRYTCSRVGNKRRYISHYEYLYPTVQQVEGKRFNNFKRESSVYLRFNEPLQDPLTADTTRQTIRTAGKCNNTGESFSTTASSFYGSIKRKIANQYGQLGNAKILHTGYTQNVEIPEDGRAYETGVVFGGDTYINRFTVKRKLQYFNQFEFDQQDGHEFDYTKYYNIPYPRFWINTEEYDVGELLSLRLPNDKHSLDCRNPGSVSLRDLSAAFRVKDAYFYLFNAGVIDFFVESEFNLDFRDYQDTLQGRHYDSSEYTDLTDMFRSDVIGYDNIYIYDKSLSKQLEENYIQTQSRDYDPKIASTCFSKFPNRVIYSLPAYRENKQDNWRAYLANNYYDFGSYNGNLVGMRAIERSGIMFFFDRSAPYIHRSVDTLKTDQNLKVTIGDGGLFSQPPQQLSVTDYWYGNTQSRHAFVQTSFGLIYPSQEQGNILLYNGSLETISSKGMEYWFSNNLHSKLVEQFPNFPHRDNTIKGVGLRAVFDNNDSTYYICKKDYVAKSNLDITYDESQDTFKYQGTPVPLGHPDYFDDASVTVSYNFKTQSWISFHDWHPDYLLQDENHFISIKDNQLWKHNQTCTSYCNFYGKQHGFEIEYVINNGVDTNILQSIQYTADCFKYFNNCTDYHNLLDFNFDQAIIHNIDQCSGNLQLNRLPKNSMRSSYMYPQVSPGRIDIGYSKEESNFRFNQFWDAVRNRAEFNDNYQTFMDTAPNGYKRTLNNSNIDYGKRITERKKFRGKWHKVILRRDNPEDVKMIFKFALNKQVKSPR